MSFPLHEFLRDLKTLCAIDSGHFNEEGVNAILEFFSDRYKALGLKVERHAEKGGEFAPILCVRNDDRQAIDFLLIAHMDTVFPVGEGARRPLTIDKDNIAHGPGCVDCKAGCLLIFYLIRDLLLRGETPGSFCIAMNSDEERGSHYSRSFFEELAKRTRYCFVFEPGRANDEFVSARKGGANYRIRCHGVAAHSGVDPETGASAILELAKWIPEIYALNDFARGSTTNVGKFQGGGDNGQVPDYAECTLSFRYLDPDVIAQLEALFDRMRNHPFDARTHIEIETQSIRPPMTEHPATQALLETLREAGQALNQPIQTLTTGGGSDGNFISCHGVATLDGCGPCGAKLHTVDEYLNVCSIEKRFVLMRQLLLQLKSTVDT